MIRRIVPATAAILTLAATRAALAFDSGLDATGKAAMYDTSGANSDLTVTVGTIIGELLGLVGVLFLVLMIYAGFLYMTAQGNEEQVEKAKGLIKNAIIGIVIVFMAYAITSFVTTNIIEKTGFKG